MSPSPRLLREMHARLLENRRLEREAAAETERTVKQLSLIGPALGAELRRMVYG